MGDTKNINYARAINHLFKTFNKNKEELSDVDFVVGISRGGLIPAALVAMKLKKPLVTAYVDKKGGVYFDREEWTEGLKLLLVDDIVRSGKTMEDVKKIVSKHGSNVKTLSIYSLTESAFKPTFTMKSKKDITLPWDL